MKAKIGGGIAVGGRALNNNLGGIRLTWLTWVEALELLERD